MEILELRSFHYVNPEDHYVDQIFLLCDVLARLTERTKEDYELKSAEPCFIKCIESSYSYQLDVRKKCDSFA
jgi:hypothetical protein